MTFDNWDQRNQFDDERSGSGSGGVFRLMLALVVVAGVLAAVGIGVLYVRQQRLGPREIEPAQDKFREAAEAFSGEPLPARDPELAAIRTLFRELGAAFTAADAARLGACLDAKRMVQELERLGALKAVPLRQRRAFATMFETQLPAQLAATAEFYAWERSDLRKCLLDRERNEALVYVRHRDADGIHTKIRWWIRKHPGGWRAYDWEDLSTSMRLTNLMATGIGAAPQGNGMLLKREADRLAEVFRAIMMEDWMAAEDALSQPQLMTLPAPLEAARRMAQGVVHLANAREEEALESWNQAEALHQDMPILSLLRAQANLALGRHEEALAQATAYLDLLGEDVDGYVAQGDALAGLNRTAEARAAYRKGLEDDPDSTDCLYSLALVLPRSDMSELGERFGRMRNPKEAFPLLAEAFVSDYEEAALEALVAAYAKIEPDDLDLAYYDAQARYWRDDDAGAAAILQAAIPRVEDPIEREAYLSLYLDAMSADGKPLEAYAASDDHETAFRRLASTLNASDDADALAKLIEAHRQRQPGDPWLDYYTGGLAQSGENWDEAAAAYRAAYQRAEQDDRDSFRVSLVHALHRAGRTLEAYREVEPFRDVFSQLASLLYWDENAEGLAALLEAHRKRDPQHDEIALYDARLKLMQKDYEAAAATARAAAENIEGEYERNQYINLYLDALIEAGKPLDAYRGAPDAEYAFEYLAYELMSRQNAAPLRELVAEHRRSHPASPWLAYYAGKAAEIGDDWAAAAGAYRAALDGADDDMLDTYRNALMNAMYRQGQALEAYTELESTPEVFDQLATLMAADDDAEQLAALVAAHRQRETADPNLATWEAEVHWLRKDYDAAARLLRTHRAALEASLQDIHWRIDDRLLRSLLRLEQYDEALALAEEMFDGEGSPWFTALVHAARGDAGETLVWLDRLAAEGYEAADFYDEEILYTALASEQFAPVREKYPRPATE